MAQRFDALEAATSLGGNNEFLVDQDGLLRRITYNTYSAALTQTASAAAQAAVAAVSGNIQAEINTLQTSVNELTSNLAIVSNIAQGALGGGVTKVSAYTLIGESSAALRSDITSAITKHTSVATELAAETSWRQATSAALRADITSAITKHTSVATELAAETSWRQVTSAALRDDITSIQPTNVRVSNINTVYNDLQDWTNHQGTNGVLSGGHITSAAANVIAVSSIVGFIRQTSSPMGQLAYVCVPATPSLNVTSGQANYIYLNYNGGTPIIQNYGAVLPGDPNTNLVIGGAWPSLGDIHITELTTPVGQTPQLVQRRLTLVDGVTRQTGLVLWETGTRNITITAGTAWVGLQDYSLAAIDTSGADTFRYYYQNGTGGVTEVLGSTQINNTQYDDGSGTLATLTNNQYGVHWVYKGLDGDTYVVYGTGSYTLAEAEIAPVPTVLPLQINSLHTLLIGKIIIAKSASTFTEIQSAFDTVFAAGTVTQHNELSGLQGGATGDYFHLTQAQRDDVVSATALVSKNTLAITSVQALVSTETVNRQATSAALSDRINTWTVESTTGGITATSADSGKLFVFTGAGAKTITLAAAMPLGWNITMLQLGTGVVSIDTAVASTSLVNASTHRALNNYGSGAVLAVAQQEGANSHAWYWLQGETQ